ncbi:MAG: 4Fe-4S dicluster domain-containing protein, partial [Nitrospiria bacterium]
MKLLKRSDLNPLVDRLQGEGVFVGAPIERAGQPVLAQIRSAEEIRLNHVIPRNSIKDFFFPQTEVVSTHKIEKETVNVEGPSLEFPEMVILMARPCDAASVASMRSVFSWKGEEDGFFLNRQANSTIIGLACLEGDGACFCTSVGLAPDTTEGSDLLLRETENGNYLTEVVTDRGRTFIKRFEDLFSEGSETPKPITPPPLVKGSDIEKILAWLSDVRNYEDALWATHAAKCVGCGGCTYVCPTCHCFDIVDEGSAFEGERRKNWDACQFDHFTQHASGHNPRGLQSERWRNRFMCKFHFYPEKFSAKGCVGCGRCIRVCYVGLDITE